ncbi:MAG TPA: adenylate/guanylate cyclase domain-containing protein [Candidatus Eisenbacteria bacterium]|nr:adenylate/guanylate cyclase domain-containing protein [Candidatus Eisenbacteria bacterium]
MGKQRVSGKQAYQNFGEVFRSVYRPREFSVLEKAGKIRATDQMYSASQTGELGHPEYLHLQAGASRTANAVVSFIDIRGFTKLSFVLDPEELLKIVQGLTQASINVITDGGGYIGEFTGDGVMAYFGDSSTTDDDATMAALEATSLLFKTVEEIVNPELKADGIDPIRIAAGMEFGEVLWSRVGVGTSSQVKPIANATFLAGKLCSAAHTQSWECKIGSQLARWVPDDYVTKVKQYGPFTVKGKQVSRELYLLDWRKLATDTLNDQGKLEESIRSRARISPFGVLGTTSVVQPTKPANPGPRPLKDQPFFGE